MSVLEVQINKNQTDPYYGFHFKNPNKPDQTSCKILLPESKIYEFMYRMEKGLVYKDNKKEVHFHKGNGCTILDTIVKEKNYQYTLYDSEKQQVEEWIKTNL